MKKVRLRAWVSYPIIVDEEVELADLEEGTIEDKLIEIAEREMANAKVIPAIMEGPYIDEKLYHSYDN